MSVTVVGLTVTKRVEVANCEVVAAPVIVTVAGQLFCRLFFSPAGEAQDDDNIEHTKKRLRMMNIFKDWGCRE